MILPTKHLSQGRALLTLGGSLLKNMSHPKTVSALWEDVTQKNSPEGTQIAMRYERFVLALDLLFIMGAVEIRDGLLYRTSS